MNTREDLINSVVHGKYVKQFRISIKELDPDTDEDVERLWIEETERRYQAYLAGEMETVPGEEAMQRARQRLK